MRHLPEYNQKTVAIVDTYKKFCQEHSLNLKDKKINLKVHFRTINNLLPSNYKTTESHMLSVLNDKLK